VEGDLFVSARWFGPQDQRFTNLYDSSEILVKVKIKRIRKSEGWTVRRTQGVQQVAASATKTRPTGGRSVQESPMVMAEMSAEFDWIKGFPTGER